MDIGGNGCSREVAEKVSRVRVGAMGNVKIAAENLVSSQSRITDAKGGEKGLLQEGSRFARTNLGFVDTEEGRFNIASFSEFFAIKDYLGNQGAIELPRDLFGGTAKGPLSFRSQHASTIFGPKRG